MATNRLKEILGLSSEIKKLDDKGVFVMLDSALPSRLSSAFPPEVSIQRISLDNAMFEIHKFLR